MFCLRFARRLLLLRGLWEDVAAAEGLLNAFWWEEGLLGGSITEFGRLPSWQDVVSGALKLQMLPLMLTVNLFVELSYAPITLWRVVFS